MITKISNFVCRQLCEENFYLLKNHREKKMNVMQHAAPVGHEVKRKYN